MTTKEINKDIQRDFMKRMQFNKIHFPQAHKQADKFVKENIYDSAKKNWEECQRVYIQEFEKLVSVNDLQDKNTYLN